MKTYITALQVQAEPAELDGDNGYWITFSDGWMTEKLWMPEDQFQAHFFHRTLAGNILPRKLEESCQTIFR